MNDFISSLNAALKYGDEPSNIHNAAEVKPSQYIVLKSGILQRRPDKAVSKHKTLAEAWDAWNTAPDKTGLHLYSVYPDKSMKLLSTTGGETGMYHTRINGEVVEHTPHTDLQTKYYTPPHQADAAPISHHRLTERALVEMAWPVLGAPTQRDGWVHKAGVDVGPGSQADGMVKKAMDTGDMTPMMALADYLQEQGVEKVPQQLRDRVEKFHNQVDDLRWSRLLRT